ncbi:hypothetical protein KUCAC02_032153, partial [Chaenocephalus aceratus]
RCFPSVHCSGDVPECSLFRRCSRVFTVQAMFPRVHCSGDVPECSLFRRCSRVFTVQAMFPSVHCSGDVVFPAAEGDGAADELGERSADKERAADGPVSSGLSASRQTGSGAAESRRPPPPPADQPQPRHRPLQRCLVQLSAGRPLSESAAHGQIQPAVFRREPGRLSVSEPRSELRQEPVPLQQPGASGPAGPPEPELLRGGTAATTCPTSSSPETPPLASLKRSPALCLTSGLRDGPLLSGRPAPDGPSGSGHAGRDLMLADPAVEDSFRSDRFK